MDDIFKTILKYNFNLYRGRSEVSEYLEGHYKNYYDDIKAACDGENFFLGRSAVDMVKGNLPRLKRVEDTVIKILKNYDERDFEYVYNSSTRLFDELNDVYILHRTFFNTQKIFYRIRSGNYTAKNNKKELFHITKNNRDRVGSYRFSQAGFPCLYLSSGIELAWFECGMPRKFSYCQMMIDNNEELNLVNFSLRPVLVESEVSRAILQARQDKNSAEEHTVIDILARYILLYPMLAACSLKVMKRNTGFVEEYIFPQIFMSWLAKSNDYDGVIYESSLNSDLIRGMGAKNVVLPVKTMGIDGLDERLTKIFSVSDICFFDIDSHFEKKSQDLRALQALSDELFIMYGSEEYSDYMRLLKDTCDYILKLYQTVIGGEYKNTELIFYQFAELSRNTNLLDEYREQIIEKSKKDFVSLNADRISFDEKKAIEYFERFHSLCKKVISPNEPFLFNVGGSEIKNFEHIGNTTI